MGGRSLTPGSGRLFCALLLCCFCSLNGCFAASANDTFVPDNDTCNTNFTLRPSDPPKPLPPELLLQLANNSRTQVTFDVKACSDAQVILYGIDFKPPELRAGVVKIVFGADNRSMSVIESCESSSSGCETKNSAGENPLDCEDFKTFGVSWETGGVEVFKLVTENGTEVWRSFLKFHSTVTMQGVFGAYKFNEGDSRGNVSGVSEWRFHGPCVKSSDDTSSMVTRGHLAGAVIATLLAGIIIGAVCIKYGPKLVAYIRQTLAGRNKNRAGGDEGTEEELSTLMTVQASPDSKPQQSSPGVRPAAGTTTTTTTAEARGTKLDLALPGDDPPPPDPAPSSASSPTGGSRGKASNTYTPYHEMGGAAATAAAATATPSADDVSPKKRADKAPKPAPKKKDSKTGRTMASPLPALPVDDVATAAASTSGVLDDVYVNADAHVYEGMHHEGPIYENRNTGVYEPLKPGPNDK